MKRSLGSRILVTAFVAVAFGVGGVATGTAASATDNDPTPPSGSCVDRQIKEHNGSWFLCENGTWKHQKLGTSLERGPVEPVKQPPATRNLLGPDQQRATVSYRHIRNGLGNFGGHGHNFGDRALHR